MVQKVRNFSERIDGYRVRLQDLDRIPKRLSEVAEVMGVSRERIRQIEQAALAKLRRLPGLRNEVIEYLAA